MYNVQRSLTCNLTKDQNWKLVQIMLLQYSSEPTFKHELISGNLSELLHKTVALGGTPFLLHPPLRLKLQVPTSSATQPSSRTFHHNIGSSSFRALLPFIHRPHKLAR
jgi:hypothetical protein